MSEIEIEYPESTLAYLNRIVASTGIPIEEIKQEYAERFMDDFIQTDPQIPDDDTRHYVVTMGIWNAYKARRPLDGFTVSFLGLGGINKSRKGKLNSDAFTLYNHNGKAIIKRVVIQESAIKRRKEILLPTRDSMFEYSTKLGQFADDGDLIADDRALFEDPTIKNIDVLEFLKSLGVPEIDKLSDMAQYPSGTAVGSDGKEYPIRSDWRIITGTISSSSVFAKKDRNKKELGVDGGSLRIIDLSLGLTDEITEEGEVQRNTRTVWCAPELLQYANESICKFIGTIAVKKETNEPTMNAYLILPVITRPMPT